MEVDTIPDLLVIAILILVIILPIIYVAIPNKAQHDLNQSTLEVTSQEVTKTAPDGIHLKLESVARSTSKYHPTIEAFEAGLHLENGEDFLIINVPSTKAEAETQIVIDQDAKFASLDAFIAYNKLVMASDSFDVYMTGKPKLKLSGLPKMSVDYNKKVTMKGKRHHPHSNRKPNASVGLNHLKGLNITDLEILAGDRKPLPDGSNMIGRVIIPNPSVMTLDLGNVTMNLQVNGTDIGTSLLPNLVLHPGTNNVSMQSNVKLITVSALIAKSYPNKIIPLDISGNSSINAQGEHLTYFEEAIKSNTVKVDLNVGPAMAAIGLD